MHSLQKLGHTVQLAQVLSANSRVCFNVWYNYICKSYLAQVLSILILYNRFIKMWSLMYDQLTLIPSFCVIVKISQKFEICKSARISNKNLGLLHKKMCMHT